MSPPDKQNETEKEPKDGGASGGESKNDAGAQKGAAEEPKDHGENKEKK